MWIIYTVDCRSGGNASLKCNAVDLCCYTHEFERAMDALDDYAIAKFRLKNPDYPNDANPLDDETRDWTLEKYRLEFDEGHVTRDGDYERINLFRTGTREVIRYFELADTGKYIDDYVAERTDAVVELENDARIDVTQDILGDESDG